MCVKTITMSTQTSGRLVQKLNVCTVIYKENVILISRGV